MPIARLMAFGSVPWRNCSGACCERQKCHRWILAGSSPSGSCTTKLPLLTEREPLSHSSVDEKETSMSQDTLMISFARCSKWKSQTLIVQRFTVFASRMLFNECHGYLNSLTLHSLLVYFKGWSYPWYMQLVTGFFGKSLRGKKVRTIFLPVIFDVNKRYWSLMKC